jgi:hypothetical protein
MRGPDSDPQGQDVAGALMAVDATLAGDPVDPEYAELAELALILRRERPRTSDAFTARLDEQVQRRFARPAPAVRGAGLRRWLGQGKRALLAPTAGLLAAAAGVALVVVLTGGNHAATFSNGVASSSASVASPTTASPGTSSAAAATSAAASAPPGRASGAASRGQSVTPDARRLSPAGKHAAATPTSEASSGAASGSATSAASASAPGTVVPSPVIPGKRQVVQSAQLMLGVSPSRIDDVSQQVFDVIGQEKGYVNSSNVTSGVGGNAYFQLSVPSSNLAATLAALSQLKSAHVLSRTDNTNDITGQVGGVGQRLAEARALRSSLLKQLANAVTTEQVDSVQARLHDANASIASDLSTLRGLQRQVAYSNITLRIQSVTAPGPGRARPSQSSGFTIGSAAHDAGRVLVVVAGVALIVLAVMVPLGLVAALIAWVGFAVRRRRRDQALDLV